jgi:tetratricopeptide (TPR) repeat protein
MKIFHLRFAAALQHFATVVVVFLVCTSVTAQHAEHAKKTGAEKPAELVSGLGSHHHPVSTEKPEAQKFFDQGLSYVFAFNHEEAIRSFKRAAEIDPELAMAYWGIGLALGPNINLDVDPQRERAAYEATQKAMSLAAKAPENERVYIEALAKRYSLDLKADLKKLAVDYKNAMGELVKLYPDDLDAATLFAEAAMDLRPWKFWSADGKPAEGTEEIVAVLESVLRRNPNHAGAIHYYIHAVEASSNPERALAFAPKLPSLMPAAGHLVHMPAHIYQRTGDYAAAARSNKEAALADEVYIKTSGGHGLYPLMYYSHNLHFLAIAQNMEGRFSDAMSAAKRLESYVGPSVKEMPMLEGFMTVPPLILVQFHRWDEIEKLPPPEAALVGLNATWHFARGMAYAAKGKTIDAEREYAALVDKEKKIPADLSFNLNSASAVLKIADYVLAARIAKVKNGDNKKAIELLRKAVELEDSLAYDEPPAWFLPVRVWLGTALMSGGAYAEAEQVFRADLERNKRNGRSLFGLMESLKAQKKSYAASLVQREFQEAWKNSDTKLSLEEL